MKNEKNVINGYCFENEESLKNAKNELEGIEYLKKRTNYSNPQNVWKIYHTVIEKRLFKTPVGYDFLKELQQYLEESKEIDNSQIAPIPVWESEKKGKKVRFDFSGIKRAADKTSPYRNRFINMVILNVILLIILVLFIFISNNSHNLNIINYKNRIDAEYTEKEDNLAKWEEEISLREQELEKNQTAE
ncbi:MAG: hypothetical protein SPF70_05850 [Lachnospiraceae bacterium]|nr:hypothetical protein [Lachnospiraceae bacterium]